jgi:hypothetical protein
MFKRSGPACSKTGDLRISLREAYYWTHERLRIRFRPLAWLNRIPLRPCRSFFVNGDDGVTAITLIPIVVRLVAMCGRTALAYPSGMAKMTRRAVQVLFLASRLCAQAELR